MKTYHLLNVPIPTISYCIVHQSRTALFNDEYARLTKALHDRVQKESAEMRSAYAKGIQDAITRESQALSGLLSPFLTTPIRSDKDEVRRILADGLEAFSGQMKVTGDIGVGWSFGARICLPSAKKSIDRKLQLNGKSYLQELGFTTDAAAGDILESVFVVEGGANLDLIEHMVRDRMGIYAEPHGAHLKESGAYTFAAYNLVYASGTRPSEVQGKGLLELAMVFSKPAVEYTQFRQSIISALGQWPESDTVMYTTLWQRKLGLGKGREFILRFVCNDQQKIDKVAHWLHDSHGPDFPTEALIEKGAMFYKELLW